MVCFIMPVSVSLNFFFICYHKSKVLAFVFNAFLKLFEFMIFIFVDRECNVFWCLCFNGSR